MTLVFVFAGFTVMINTLKITIFIYPRLHISVS